MSKIALTPNASGTGVFTISSPATNTNRTLTLPDEAGTVLTSASSIPTSVLTGNITQNAGPAFSAYLTPYQNISTGTYTKVALNNEHFDTSSCFDTSNYRFTPTVAGYYQVSSNIMFNSSAANPSYVAIRLYKNGNIQAGGNTIGGAASTMMASLPYLLHMNGSTDYLELYGMAAGGSGTLKFDESGYSTYLQAVLVRAT